MLKHLYLIFIATFIFGFFVGVILFLKNNTGQEGGGALPAGDTPGFTVLASMYGGCVRSGGCPSYRITSDGSYTYVARLQESGETPQAAMLSTKQYDTLSTYIRTTDFDSVMRTQFNGTCPATVDGIAYRYDILYNDTPYTLDSCVENFDGEILFAELQNYFDIFSAQYHQ